MDAPRVDALGDAAVVVTFDTALSEAANDRALALAADLRAAPLRGAVRDIVPAIASVVVHLDPRATRVEQVLDELRARASTIPKFFPVEYPRSDSEPGIFNREQFRVHEIPVRYGGEAGPDLDDVAAFAGVSAPEVIARHAAALYRVYMLGFLPGFAYLGQVDPSIAAPRRSTPRQAVPAGSVGIAGRQTGVYPRTSPGGWQVIGRTTVSMFDAAAGRSLLEPGDRVRFVPERG